MKKNKFTSIKRIGATNNGDLIVCQLVVAKSGVVVVITRRSNVTYSVCSDFDRGAIQNTIYTKELLGNPSNDSTS